MQFLKATLPDLTVLAFREEPNAQVYRTPARAGGAAAGPTFTCDGEP